TTSSCVWTGSGGASFAIVSLDVTEGVARASFDYNAQATPGAVALRGIGQGAFRVGDVLWVYAGRYRLKLASFRLPSAVGVETRIATPAVTRLESHRLRPPG